MAVHSMIMTDFVVMKASVSNTKKWDSRQRAGPTKVISADSVVPKVLNGEAFCDLAWLHPQIFEGKHIGRQYMILRVFNDVVCCEEVVHRDRNLSSKRYGHSPMRPCNIPFPKAVRQVHATLPWEGERAGIGGCLG